MRTFSLLSAVLVAVLMVGCSSTQKSDVSAGAMNGKGECCATSCDSKAAPGAMSESCATKCASQCTKTEAAPGAMSEGCATKCSKTEAAPGAMSDGNCASKCSGAKSEAAPGAMSEPKTCPMSGCKSGSKSE